MEKENFRNSLTEDLISTFNQRLIEIDKTGNKNLIFDQKDIEQILIGPKT